MNFNQPYTRAVYLNDYKDGERLIPFLTGVAIGTPLGAILDGPNFYYPPYPYFYPPFSYNFFYPRFRRRFPRRRFYR